MSNKLINVFPNTDLRCSHAGLTKLIFKHKGKVLNPELLANGEFILFINRSQSMIKMFASNNVLIHYKSPRGRIDVRTIEYLPHCFNAGELNYDAALKKVLEKHLIKREGN